MDQIQIANILLTRRCNLRCDYCAIVRDYDGMPSEYPDMKYYKDNELEVAEWMRILNRLKKNNPDVFIIFYGGEPFLYDGLNHLIKYCHKEDIAYTIISNNTPAMQPKIIELFEALGEPIKGFTASIDPDLAKHFNLLRDRDASLPHSILKTLEGYNNLKELKESGVADDVVAEITIMPDNSEYLLDTVRILSDANIWCSITTIDDKKSDYYDFSTISNPEFCIRKGKTISYQFMECMTDDSLKVHIPELLPKLYKVLPWNMKCNIYDDVHNVTIDSDGNFRLCLRIRGQYAPSVKLDSIMDDDGRILPFFKSSLKQDYDKMCRGCNWTCMAMSGYFSGKIKEHN